MEFNEVVATPQQAVEFTKAATPLTVAALELLADAVKTVFGPTAEEVGVLMSVPFRDMKINRLISGFQKTSVKAKAAGLTLRVPDPKLFEPIFQGMSLEGDETLQDMWASLLVNVSNPRTPDMVTPRFVSILRSLSPNEARTLQAVYDAFSIRKARISIESLITTVNDPLIQKAEMTVILEGLESDRLVISDEGIGYKGHQLTPLGDAFVRACQPPKPSTP